MAVYTFRDLKFTCEDWQKINGQCPITTVVLKVERERWLGRLWRKLGGGKKKSGSEAQASTTTSETVG
jgi:hypothetical protein